MTLSLQPNIAQKGASHSCKASNSHYRQHSQQPRQFSQSKGQKPRANSNTNDNSNERRSFLRRHSSHPTAINALVSEPIYVLNHPPVASAFTTRSPPQPLADSTIAIISPSQTPVRSPEYATHRKHSLGPLNTVMDGVGPEPSHNTNRRPIPSQDVRVIAPHFTSNHRYNGGSNSSSDTNQSRQVSSNHQVASYTTINSANGSPAQQIWDEAFANAAPTYQANYAFNMNRRTSGVVSRSQNQAIRITLNDKYARDNHDETGLCTMMIRHVSEVFFKSQGFKELLDQFGDVQNMSFKIHNRGYDKGAAYVHYASQEMAEHAVSFFKNFTPPGGALTLVALATPKTHASSRSGGYSGRVDSYHQRRNSSNMRADRRYSPHKKIQSRRASVHYQDQVYRPHQYSNNTSRAHSSERQESLTEGFQQQLETTIVPHSHRSCEQLISATAKIEQHEAALAQMVPPLHDVHKVARKHEEVSKSETPSDLTGQKCHVQKSATSSSKKENMPMSQAQHSNGKSGGKPKKQGAHKIDEDLKLAESITSSAKVSTSMDPSATAQSRVPKRSPAFTVDSGVDKPKTSQHFKAYNGQDKSESKSSTMSATATNPTDESYTSASSGVSNVASDETPVIPLALSSVSERLSQDHALVTKKSYQNDVDALPSRFPARKNGKKLGEKVELNSQQQETVMRLSSKNRKKGKTHSKRSSIGSSDSHASLRKADSHITLSGTEQPVATANRADKTTNSTQNASDCKQPVDLKVMGSPDLEKCLKLSDDKEFPSLGMPACSQPVLVNSKQHSFRATTTSSTSPTNSVSSSSRSLAQPKISEEISSMQKRVAVALPRVNEGGPKA